MPAAHVRHCHFTRRAFRLRGWRRRRDGTAHIRRLRMGQIQLGRVQLAVNETRSLAVGRCKA